MASPVVTSVIPPIRRILFTRSLGFRSCSAWKFEKSDVEMVPSELVGVHDAGFSVVLVGEDCMWELSD
jgi:hypothetical protein